MIRRPSPRPPSPRPSLPLPFLPSPPPPPFSPCRSTASSASRAPSAATTTGAPTRAPTPSPCTRTLPAPRRPLSPGRRQTHTPSLHSAQRAQSARSRQAPTHAAARLSRLDLPVRHIIHANVDTDVMLSEAPHISTFLPISPHISPYLPISHVMLSEAPPPTTSAEPPPRGSPEASRSFPP